MTLDARVSYKLLPSKLLHGVYVFLELEELLFFYVIVFGEVQR